MNTRTGAPWAPVLRFGRDQPVNADDDGKTAPDGDGIGRSMAQVRAERSGEGDGPVYHISFTATDAFGNPTTGAVTVEVFHRSMLRCTGCHRRGIRHWRLSSTEADLPTGTYALLVAVEEYHRLAS